MIQHFGNLQQLLKIDAFALEQFVDIRFLAIDLFSQPNHSAALTAQFFLDHLADVKFFHLKLHGRFVLKHDAKIEAWQKHLKKAVKKKIKIFQNKY
jgi:hypothetical protein